MPRLKRVDTSEPGISRRRQGRGFVYTDPSGRRLNDADEFERIRQLAIPPAWKDVWICPFPNGHLQAVGTDAAGGSSTSTTLPGESAGTRPSSST